MCVILVNSVVQRFSVWLFVINHYRHNSAARPTFLRRQLPDLHRQDPRPALRWWPETLRHDDARYDRRGNCGFGRRGISSGRREYVERSASQPSWSDGKFSHVRGCSGKTRASEVRATVEAGAIATRSFGNRAGEVGASTDAKVSHISYINSATSNASVPTVSFSGFSETVSWFLLNCFITILKIDAFWLLMCNKVLLRYCVRTEKFRKSCIPFLLTINYW